MNVRFRLTLAFTAVMAGVLAAAAVLVYVRVASDLDRALDDQLRLRAQDVAAVVRGGGSLDATMGNLIERGETFAEVVDARGSVTDSTPPIGKRLLLTRAELAHAARGPVSADLDAVPGLDEGARVLAVPFRDGVLVVGTTRENRAETLRTLRAAFLLGIPVALVLAALGGYALAGAALRPVEESIARERRFVADASHELRTPLALLKAELELALKEGRTHDELARAIRSAADETDRLARLADDLLLLARAQRGRLSLRSQPTDLADVLQTVAARFERRAESERRPLAVLPGEPLVVSADRLHLEQAVGNLVANALDHGRGRVTLIARANDGFAELHVVDEGAGFERRAFERFSGRGTGLGLAIVETVAVAHGGNAHVAGADVWISLPLIS